MGGKSIAGRTSRTCTVGAKIKKIIISSNFSLKLLLTVIYINFLLKLNTIYNTIYNRNEPLKHPVYIYVFFFHRNPWVMKV